MKIIYGNEQAALLRTFAISVLVNYCSATSTTISADEEVCARLILGWVKGNNETITESIVRERKASNMPVDSALNDKLGHVLTSIQGRDEHRTVADTNTLPVLNALQGVLSDFYVGNIGKKLNRFPHDSRIPREW